MNDPIVPAVTSHRTLRKLRLYQLLAVVLFIATSAMTVLLVEQRSSRVATQERLDTLNRLCQVTRTNLKRAADVIRTNGAMKAIEIQRVKDAFIELDTCPTTPFDFDRWTTCVDNNNDACMVTLLEGVAENIGRATRKRQLP